jgi:ActR/RegA family two-component response regulator
MSCDVLILDDDRGAGQEYARLVERETGLRVVFTDSPKDALELIRTNLVKVAVLDQRIGATRGTDVFGKLHEIDPLVKGVMFTGQADAAEVGEAMGGGSAQYLSKPDVSKLGGVVLAQYHQYQIEAASAALEHAPVTILTRKHGLPPWRRSVIYQLLKLEVVDESFVPLDEWATVVSLQAGETQKHTTTGSFKEVLTLETESQHKLNADLGLKLPEMQVLDVALKQEIQHRLKRSTTIERGSGWSQEHTYQLPPEPDDPSRLHVKSRRIERSPVYRRLKVSLLCRCSCCRTVTIVPLMVSEATGGMATRQVDTRSDGQVFTTDTGIER